MALIQEIRDGELVKSASQKSMEKNTKSGMGEDTFLQLLVAEVQNQDPLEPTSNTEWVSQYATFSELEQMQNMASSYDLSRASTLVGKTVVMKVSGSSAENASVIQGRVDYVTYEGNKAYLSINGDLYDLADLYNVVDNTYLDAYDKVYAWGSKLTKLPALGSLDLSYKDAVMNLKKEYEGFTDYEKSFVTDDVVKSLEKYLERIDELLKIKEETDAKLAAEEAAKAAAQQAEQTTEHTAEATISDAENAAQNSASGVNSDDTSSDTNNVSDEQVDALLEDQGE